MEFFGNPVDQGSIMKARKKALKLARRYGYDPGNTISIKPGRAKANPPLLGIIPLDPDKENHRELWTPPQPGIVLGTIRMGFGHYRMALAIASAINSRSLTPYWLDFLRFPDTATAGVITYLEGLYRSGSRLSAKMPLFNRLIWERVTAEVARPLSATVRDEALAEIFAQIPAGLDPSTPYIATHPWNARAARAAGMSKVVSIIPDNMPLAFNVAPGVVHAVQTPSAFLGYRTLRNMGDRVLRGLDGFRSITMLHPMEEKSIFYSGHYVDHEMVANLESDCQRRLDRMTQGAARRLLLTIGGAGAQLSKFVKIMDHLKGNITAGRVMVVVNMGDHYDRLEELRSALQDLGLSHELWDNDWPAFQGLVGRMGTENITGIHIILHRDTFPAVYSTNLLIRECDILVTKPSELSFYPIPKLFIQRVGRHEAWGAIHSAEIGDGSMETARISQVMQLLDILIHDNDLLPLYISRILANKQAGIYNGAYEVVDRVLSM